MRAPRLAPSPAYQSGFVRPFVQPDPVAQRGLVQAGRCGQECTCAALLAPLIWLLELIQISFPFIAPVAASRVKSR